jgi:hypothetical protein
MLIPKIMNGKISHLPKSIREHQTLIAAAPEIAPYLAKKK